MLHEEIHGASFPPQGRALKGKASFGPELIFGAFCYHGRGYCEITPYLTGYCMRMTTIHIPTERISGK